MSGLDLGLLALAIVAAALATLFAATSQALRLISPNRAEELVDEERRGAKRLITVAADSAPYVNTMLLVNVIFEVLSVVTVAVITANLTDQLWLRITVPTVIMIIISFVLWGVIPRTLARKNPTGIALAMSGPATFLTAILGPIPQLLIAVSNIFLPGKGYSEGPFVNESELRQLFEIAADGDVIEADERKMIDSVFDLGDTVVREVMIPRPDMVWINQDKSVRQALSLSLRSGFSRIPVIADDVDEVVGILVMKDAIRRIYDDPSTQSSLPVRKIMRKPRFVPDTKPVDEVLRQMQAESAHMVIAVDEYGGTAGLITIEDILEEIVGEIVDEYDQFEIAPVTQLGTDRYRVSARLGLDEIDDLFHVHLDDDGDVETVAGLMARELGVVPIPGSTVQVDGLEFIAERRAGRRNKIMTVLVSRVTEAEATDAVTELAAQTPKPATSAATASNQREAVR